jgi:hypothetical protein
MAVKDLMKLVEVVLLREWDPIGIAEEPAAQDEYDSYAPGVARLILSGASGEAIADHLLSIEREWMGLRGNDAVARRVSELLLGLRGV